MNDFSNSMLRQPVCREIGWLQAAFACGAIAAACLWAVPRLDTLARTVELGAVHLTVASHVHAARDAAQKSRRHVRYCPSDDGQFCGETAWERGWIAFEDSDGNGVRSNAERVLHREGALPVGYVLEGNPQALEFSLCRHEQAAGCGSGAMRLVVVSGGSRRPQS